MEQQFNKPSIKISGSGSAGGGNYDQIRISGSGKITSDASCQIFKASGSTSVIGTMKAEEARMSGSTRFKKDLNAGQLKASGSVKSEANVSAKTLRASGSFTVEGELSGETLEFSGSLCVGQDLNAEQFYMNGQCQIGGLLNADCVEISLEGRSVVKAIGAGKVKVTMGKFGGFFKDLVGLFSYESGKLISESIEGDELYLENTICDVVRGGNVVIGKGCRIKLVEYSGSLDILEDAEVENQQLL